MSDLAKSLREKLARERRDRGAADRQRCHGGRRHAQMAARRRQRQRGRDRVHSRGRPRHAVHFVAGRLRARLRLLLHRQAGLQPQSDVRPRSSASSGSHPRIGARCWRTPARGARPWAHAKGERVDQQRRHDGHGRAAGEFRQCGHGAAPDAGRQRLRPVAPARDAVHLGHRAGDRPPARRLPGGAGGVAARAQRRAARHAGADQQEISAAPNCWPPAGAIWTRRRAISSPSST